jgi:hypothetical protein
VASFATKLSHVPHLCTRRMIIAPCSLWLHQPQSTWLYIFISSFIDIVICASTFAARMDGEACALHRRIRAKNSEGRNCWKECMRHGTVIQVENRLPLISECGWRG